jgi:hypothetical protein
MMLIVAYVGYLVQAGLLMVMLPWSEAWSVMLVRLPTSLAAWLDSPAIRGVVTAFGVLHLMLLAIEVRLSSGQDAIRSIGLPK